MVGTLLGALIVLQDAEAHAALAREHADARRWAEAAEEYRLAGEADPLYRSLALNRGAALVEAGETDAALEALDEAEGVVGATYGAYIDLLRGDALARAERRDEARVAYERCAASEHPAHAPQARIRMAELNALEGRYDEAEEELEQIERDSPRVADQARQVRERLRTIEEADRSWWARLEVGVEWDDNVVFLGDDNPLAAQIRDTEDFRFVYGASGGVILHRDDDWLFAWEADVYATAHQSVDSFDLFTVSTGPIVSRRVGPVRLTLRAPLSWVWLSGDSYQRDFAPSLSATIEPDGLPEWARLAASYLTVTVYYRDREFQFSTGGIPQFDRTGETPGLSLSREFHVAPEIDGVLTVGGGYSANMTRGSDYDSRQWEVWAQWSSRFVEETTITARVGYAREEFIHSNSLAAPAFSRRRRDDRFTVHLELRRPIVEHVEAKVYWTYTDNDSTIGAHGWRQNIVGAGVEVSW